MAEVVQALEVLRAGRPVLVFDAEGREAEVDMVYASSFVTPEAVRALRRDATGLICTTVSPEVRDRLALPFADELLLASSDPVLRRLAEGAPRYDRRSAFGLTINHRDTFTGVTDRDVSLTITRFADLAARAVQSEDGWARETFAREFQSPGHVHLIYARGPLLHARLGHTELTTALAVMAGLAPTATVCEMMDANGGPVSRADAKAYAEAHDTVLLEGKEIVGAWKAWSASWPSASSTSST